MVIHRCAFPARYFRMNSRLPDGMTRNPNPFTSASHTILPGSTAATVRAVNLTLLRVPIACLGLSVICCNHTATKC